jgi:hypothetical protein
MIAFAAPDLSAFINRKGFYGVVVLAACKANLEFVFFSAKHTGSTNDVVAIQGCEGGAFYSTPLVLNCLQVFME